MAVKRARVTVLGSAKWVSVTSVERDGRYQVAFLFRYGVTARRLAYVASVLLAAAGVALLVAANGLADQQRDPLAGSVVGLSVVGFFCAVALLLRRDRAGIGAYVALVPEGVVARSAFGTSFVPWDAIAEVALVETSRSRCLGVRLSASDAVQAGPRARRAAAWQRRLTGYDLGYPVDGLSVPPELLAWLVERYARHPEARAEIGTAEGLLRLGSDRAAPT